MRILIAGGHLTPALAVITALPKDAKVLYVGRKHPLEGDHAISLEYQTILAHNIPFKEIKTGRLQRSFTRHTFTTLSKIPQGFWEAKGIIEEFKPDIIVGFGGYVSVPLGMVGYLKKIPLLIHEQTLDAGLANKLLAKFAKKICVSWKSSEGYFPKDKTVLTGNPALSDIFSPLLERKKTHNRFQIVVVGGSQGSHAINVLIEQILKKIIPYVTIIHQTGDATEYRDFDRLSELRNELSPENKLHYRITKFIQTQEMNSLLTDADLVITRGGMNTLATLLLLNKPALIFPLNREQLKNALFFKNHGLGEVIMQKDALPNVLLSKITGMINHITTYTNHEGTDELMIHAQACKRIITLLYDITQSTKQTSDQELPPHSR